MREKTRRHAVALVVFIPLLFLLAGCPAYMEEARKEAAKVYVANMNSNTVSVIDGKSYKVIRTVDAKGHHTHDLWLTPDGKRLFATNMQTGTVSVIDTATDEVVATISTGTLTHAIAVSPDGKNLWVVPGKEPFLPIFDTASLMSKGAVTLKEPIGTGHVWISPDGKKAYITSPPKGEVLVASATLDKSNVPTVTTTIKVGKTPTFIQVSPDGKEVWGTNTGESSVYVIDVATNKVMETIEVGKNPQHLTFAGGKVYVSLGGQNEVAVVDPASRKVTGRFPVGKIPHGIWPSPDGATLYVANEGEGTVSVVDRGSGKVVATVPVGQKPVAVVTLAR